MSAYLLVKTLHILSAAVLFGTGLGIAFFMVRSHFTDNLQQKIYAARNTVLADTLFTLPAVVIQPVTGIWLMLHAGFRLTDFWIMSSIGLYLFAGACWLPVVWIQLRLRQLLQQAAITDTPLTAQYQRLFALWFILGWPAFIAVTLIFYLMVAKPV
ncbi:MAG: DUF2269 domain-containing protein [Gammaproteobacteria bacterium]